MSAILTVISLLPMVFRANFADENTTVRPMATVIVVHNVKAINSFRRARNPSLVPDEFCFIEQVQRDSLVLTNRDGQKALNDMYRESDATFDLVAAGDIRLTVGVY